MQPATQTLMVAAVQAAPVFLDREATTDPPPSAPPDDGAGAD